MLLHKALGWLLLASGALGAAAPSGPVSNNPRVEIKVKFKPDGDPNNFLGDNDEVKYQTKKAVLKMLEYNNVDETLYEYPCKVKWDHGAVDGDYYVAYVYFQFKYGYYEKAQALYDAVSRFDYDSGADGSAAATKVKDEIKKKLDPGYAWHDSDTDCNSRNPEYGWYEKDASIICQGYYKCLGKDTSGCSSPTDCDVCNNYEYDDYGHTCNAVYRNRDECELLAYPINSQWNDDEAACRLKDGTYFYATDAMVCSGKPGTSYESAYVCNALDLSYCWGEGAECAACSSMYYYTSSNPLKNCTFTPESTEGKCLTGFCRNNNCYVKKLAVVLSNMSGENKELKTGHYITICYLAAAVLTIAATVVFQPPSLRSTGQLNEMISKDH